MDGEWEPPMIPNPEYKVGRSLLNMSCDLLWAEATLSIYSANRYAAWQLHLCLQGEWKPKQIDNPNYKGAWVHPEIDNPEYSADSSIYKFDNIGVLGLDLWQVRRGEKEGKEIIPE